MEKTMDSNFPHLFSPNEVFFLLIILDGIIILIGYYSTFWCVIQVLLFIKLFLCMWRIWAQRISGKAEFPAKKPCIDRNIDDKLSQEAEMLTQGTLEVLSKKPCLADDDEITIRELITVMGKMGTSYEPDSDELQERQSSNDIAALFEEQEPSLQELQQAFTIFDENNDGFIDAKEIRKVICALCLTEASEADCKGMIRAYDDNGDGVIDFNEFMGLVATSFS